MFLNVYVCHYLQMGMQQLVEQMLYCMYVFGFRNFHANYISSKSNSLFFYFCCYFSKKFTLIFILYITRFFVETFHEIRIAIDGATFIRIERCNTRMSIMYDDKPSDKQPFTRTETHTSIHLCICTCEEYSRSLPQDSEIAVISFHFYIVRKS